MANVTELPCDGEGICMACKVKPAPEETLACKTCVTPWHIPCLTSLPVTMVDAESWECPDCSSLQPAAEVDAAASSSGVGKSAVSSGGSSDLVAAIKAIEADASLTDQQKAKRRQELLSGGAKPSDGDEVNEKKDKSNDVMDILGGSLNCSFCMQLPERPVTTPCGHNFCLKCFQRWIGQGKRTCANCRNEIPAKMASNPRINSALVMAIRMAKTSKSNIEGVQPKVYHFYHYQDRPDKAFTTERAKKAGKANACSGKIFVTVPPDHFGPIPAENDPERGQSVLVGESWEDRMECRQWGVHLPHVAGIAGQSAVGAQSVCLSGGYEDDEDHGEWFLYTGSGGKDLGGNKRTNKVHSSSQEFEKLNEALRVSCKKGYPARVVRSHKEKRSAYAPEAGVRYDGIYRIEKCWRKPGIQGFIVCRYLFVRCDNDPAPWTSDDHGDRPRPLPVIKELKNATDITERKGKPAWDYNEEKGRWMWTTPPPPSRKRSACQNTGDGIVRRKRHPHVSLREILLKEFSCQICREVMTLPITTPCAHNFCKGCLEEAFSGQSYIRQRGEGRRSLRAQKNIMRCPACSIDIADFLQNPQVNRELMGVIESLQNKIAEEEEKSDEGGADGEKEGGDGADGGNDAEDECSEECEGLEANAVNTALKRDEKSDDLQSSNDQAKTVEADEIKEGSGDEKPKQIHKRKQCSDMENPPPPVQDSEAALGRKRVKVAAAISDCSISFSC